MFGISRKSKSSSCGFFRSLRTFRRREDGVAAVEFGLVLAPFLAMLFAIIETAMIFLASQTMETAVASSSRLILTGQAQTTANLDQEGFKREVCDRVKGLFDCSDKMIVDVQKYTSFASADLSRPVDGEGKVKPGVYNPGGPCEIVVARLIYQFPTFTSVLGFDLADMAGNKRLLVATSVFRNEPYQGSSC